MAVTKMCPVATFAVTRGNSLQEGVNTKQNRTKDWNRVKQSMSGYWIQAFLNFPVTYTNILLIFIIVFLDSVSLISIIKNANISNKTY